MNNTRQDLIRIAEQLLTYVTLESPESGVFQNTKSNANNILLSLINFPTYVFDYQNLQEKTSKWDSIDHLHRIATSKPTKGNYLTKIVFPNNSVLDHVLYLTITADDEHVGALYTHLTLPKIKPEHLKDRDVEVTPRCLGLHTVVSLDPDDKEIAVDLCTTNKALHKEYRDAGGSIDYSDLYHHTLFSMTYALENLLCRKHNHRIALPKDDKQNTPSLAYTEVQILDQPTDAQQ